MTEELSVGARFFMNAAGAGAGHRATTSLSALAGVNITF
jgi:hypothetical protein